MSLVTLIFIFMELSVEFFWRRNSWYGVGFKMRRRQINLWWSDFQKTKERTKEKKNIMSSFLRECNFQKGFKVAVKRLGGKVSIGETWKGGEKVAEFLSQFSIKKGTFLLVRRTLSESEIFFEFFLRQKCDTIDLLRVLWSHWNFSSSPFFMIVMTTSDDYNKAQIKSHESLECVAIAMCCAEGLPTYVLQWHIVK